MATASWFQSRTDDQLRALLEGRPDLGDPPPASFAGLAGRASSWQSVHQAIQGLDSLTADVVDALCLLAAPATAGEVAGLLGVPGEAAAVAGALDRLVGLALAEADGRGRWAADPLVRQVVRRPAGLGPSAEAHLRGQHRSFTDLVAVLVGGISSQVARSGTKADSVRRALAALGDPGRLGATLLDAPSEARAIFEHVVGGGRVEATPRASWSFYDQRTPVGWLYARGLLVPGPDGLDVPREVCIALRGGTPFCQVSTGPPPLAAAPVDPAEVVRRGAAAATAALAAVEAVAGEWAARPATGLKAGGVVARDVKRAARAADVDVPTAALAAELAFAAGLLAVEPDGAVVAAPAWDDWLAEAPAGRWTTLVRGWLAVPRWPRLAGQQDHRGKAVPPLCPGDTDRLARELRRAVVQVLAELPDGWAATAEAVAARALWTAPRRWEAGPVRPPARLALAVLEEAAFLGVTAAGTTTPAARAVIAGDLDRARQEAEAALGRPTTEVTLQADLTAVVAGAADPALWRELCLAADVESRGAATVWRFSEASVRRALDAGRTAEGILTFLGGAAPRGVPQPLAYLVADAGRRHGEARVVGAGACVHSDDPAILARFAASRCAARLGVRLLAPTVLVTAAAPSALLDALRAEGVLAVEEALDGTFVPAAPAQRRAARVPPWTAEGAGDPTADLTSLIARLRSAGVDPGSGGSVVGALWPAPGPVDQTQLPWEADGFDDPYDDPIVDDPDEIVALLTAAARLGVVVELAWSTAGEGYREAMVQVAGVVDGELLAFEVGSRRERRIPLYDVDWVGEPHDQLAEVRW